MNSNLKKSLYFFLCLLFFLSVTTALFHAQSIKVSAAPDASVSFDYSTRIYFSSPKYPLKITTSYNEAYGDGWDNYYTINSSNDYVTVADNSSYSEYITSVQASDGTSISLSVALPISANSSSTRTVTVLINCSTHSYGNWTTSSAASCTSTGTQRRSCTVCGHYEERIISALGHSLTHHSAVAATCTSTGTIEYWSCSRCNRNYSNSAGTTAVSSLTTSPLGHSYTATVTAPTLNSQGYTTHRCTRCSASYVDTYTARLTSVTLTVQIVSDNYPITIITAEDDNGDYGDSYNEQSTLITQATTFELYEGNGYKRIISITNSNGKIVYSHTNIPIDYIVDTSLTVNVTAFCSTHSYGNWTTSSAATCTSTGTQRRSCTVCGHYEERIISSLGHSLTHHSAVAATCTSTGTIEYWSCSRCNRNYSNSAGTTAVSSLTTSPLGHSYTATVTAPTLNSQGYTTHRCTRCSASYVDTYTARLTSVTLTVQIVSDNYPITIITAEDDNGDYGDSYNEQSTLITQATTFELYEGNAYKRIISITNSNGKIVYSHTNIPIDYIVDTSLTVNVTSFCSTHSYGNWTTLSAATCTSTGTQRRSCTVCGHYEERIISALGHSLTHHSAVAATCTSTGTIEYWSCSRCNRNYSNSAGTTAVSSLTTSPLGHSYAYTSKVAPTLNAGGYEIYTCSRCGATQRRNVTAKLTSITITITFVSNAYPITVYTWEDDPNGDGWWNGYTMSSASNNTLTIVYPNKDSYVDYILNGYNWRVPFTAIPAFNSFDVDTSLTVNVTAFCSTHSYGNWTTSSAATCTSTGTLRRSCTGCGHYEEQIISALGHKMTYSPTKATCTQSGEIDYWHCENCNNNYNDENGESRLYGIYWINALGHNYETCSDDVGEYEYCTRCELYFVLITIQRVFIGNTQSSDYVSEIYYSRTDEENLGDTWISIPNYDNTYISENSRGYLQGFKVNGSSEYFTRDEILVMTMSYNMKIEVVFMEVTTTSSVFKNILNGELIPLYWIMGSLACIWGVWIGIKIIRAKQAEDSAKAKVMIINLVIGLVIIAALIVCTPAIITGFDFISQGIISGLS